MHAAALEPSMPSVSESVTVGAVLREIMVAQGLTPRRLRLARGRLFAVSSGSLQGLQLLLSGHLKLLRFSDDGKVMLVDLLEAGDVFGESAVLDPDAEAAEPASYVQALSDTTVDSLPPQVVQRILERDPQLSLSLARLLSQRRVEMERRLVTQVFDRVPVRLADRLVALAERFGVPERGNGRREMRLAVPLSQQDLANWIGASREIVSLTLAEFRRAGAVTKRGRTLIVRPEALRALSTRAR